MASYFHEAARAVGLLVSAVSERSMVGWSFPAFRRELVEPETPEAKTELWMYGVRDGVSILVRRRMLFERGVMLVRLGDDVPHYPFTSVLVELDPPIFAGLRIVPHAVSKYLPELPSSADILPDLARWASYDAHDPARAALLLAEVGDALVRAERRATVCVHDGMLEVLTSGAPDAADIRQALDVAIPLAQLISSRARALPERPWAAAMKDGWLAAASALGLSFDPVRWHVGGLLDGVRVEAVVESGPSGLYTSVRASFKEPLHCGVYVRRGRRLEYGFLAGFGSSADWTMKGAPDLGPDLEVRALRMDRVVELFAIGDVRERIVAALTGADVLALHDREIVAGFSGVIGPDALTAALQRIVAAVEAFTPSRTAGPYR